MRCSYAASALAFSTALAALVACGDTAVVVTVVGDLEVPVELDGICVAVADRDPGGGEHAAFHPLVGASLPQTLVVEPGSAESGVASARGSLGGIEVARDRRVFDFGGGVEDLVLALDRCRTGRSGAPRLVDSAPAAAGARVAVSFGRGGSLVIVVGPGETALYDPRDGMLEALGLALPAAATASPPTAIAAFDSDGDCDDDLVVLLPDAGPVLWRRQSDGSFADDAEAFAGAGLTPMVAVAAADVDHDGDLDLAIGGGGVLRLLRNDGGGIFQGDAAAIPGGAVTDVTALAFGDIDGDGHVDLIIGQGAATAAPPRVLVNDDSGAGFFQTAPGALPEVALRARAVIVAQVTGNALPDVLVASEGAAVRLYVNRGDGRLEDRSFLALPSADPIAATGAALGDWTGDCAGDAVIARGSQPPLIWRGSPEGSMTAETFTGATGDQVVVADLDDDGVLDAVLAGTDGLHWVGR